MLALNCFVHQLPGLVCFCRSFLVFLAACSFLLKAILQRLATGFCFLPSLQVYFKGPSKPKFFRNASRLAHRALFPSFSESSRFHRHVALHVYFKRTHFKVSLQPKRKSRSPTLVIFIRDLHDQGNKGPYWYDYLFHGSRVFGSCACYSLLL